MSLENYDVILVGQGLAGSCLAWRLLERGQRILVIDRDEAVTSSKIAAGLMTPIVGQRFTLSWRFSEFHDAALPFYRGLEDRSGSQLLRSRRYVRVFRDEQERDRCESRLPEMPAALGAHLFPAGADELGSFHAPWGGFYLPEVMQLDAATFLKVTRNHLEERSCFRAGQLQHDEPMQHDDDGVSLPRFGVRASRVIYCGGADDRFVPRFTALKFLPAKGEILSVKTSVFSVDTILSSGIWLAPSGPDTYRLGATYDSQNLNQHPTEGGRKWLLGRLGELVSDSAVEVVDHQAAVRPALDDQKPILGLCPSEPRIGIFNGLGSKGSLQAPWLAEHFVFHLLDGTPLIPEVVWRGNN